MIRAAGPVPAGLQPRWRALEEEFGRPRMIDETLLRTLDERDVMTRQSAARLTR